MEDKGWSFGFRYIKCDIVDFKNKIVCLKKILRNVVLEGFFVWNLFFLYLVSLIY